MHKNPNQWLLSNETLKKENFKIKKVKKLDYFCRRNYAKLLLQFFNDFFFFFWQEKDNFMFFMHWFKSG